MDLRRAAQIGVPPCRYLGLPWPDWCETDILLDRAVSFHDARLCSCGCGHWESETHGDDNDGEFAVVEETCHARAALDAKLRGFKDKRPDGLILYTRRKADDED